MVAYNLQTVLIMALLISLSFGALQQPLQVPVHDKAKLRRSIAVALSGGVAGGIATGLLYPIDTLKTIRQSDKALQSASNAFETLRKNGVITLYSGILPATLGSIPSSALYFGAYEGAKQWLDHNFGKGNSRSNMDGNAEKMHKNRSNHDLVGKSVRWGVTLNRPVVHMLAAATGNIASSLVFVPKEAIKQKLQAINTGAMKSLGVNEFAASKISAARGNVGVGEILRHTWRTSGLKGFYPPTGPRYCGIFQAPWCASQCTRN